MKENPTILAIETSTDACSVALSHEGQIAARHEVAPREHIRLILSKIDELLAQSGITVSNCDAIAFGRGPGSFTGLRIAASVAQGLAFGAELPVIGISSLQILAQTALNEVSEKTPGDTILVVADARIQEVYWGFYQLAATGLMVPLIEDQLAPPAEVIISQDSRVDYAAGSGWANYADDLAKTKAQVKKMIPIDYPNATALLQLAKEEFLKGNKQVAEAALPVYLRDKVTHS